MRRAAKGEIAELPPKLVGENGDSMRVCQIGKGLLDNFKVHIILLRNREATDGTRALARPRPRDTCRLGMVAVARSGKPKDESHAKSRSTEANSASNRRGSRYEAADYLAAMLESMQQLALQQKMTFLSYLIGLALKEARLEKAKKK